MRKSWTIKTASNMTQRRCLLYIGANNRWLLHGNLHYIYPILHGAPLTLTSPYPHVVKTPLELPTPGPPITHSPTPSFFCTSNTSVSIQVDTWTPIALEVPTLRTRTVLTPWFSCPPICPSSAHANRSLKRHTPGPPSSRSSTHMYSTSVFLDSSNISLATSSCQCCS